MRTFPGGFSGILYFFSSSWMGLFIYLLLATLLCWPIFALTKMTGRAPDVRTLFLAACLLAAGASVYGTVRAGFPALKSVDIPLSGLPESWRGRTIVQLSDVHLGAIRGTGFLERVVNLVDSAHPDLVLITGDLFDGISSGDLSDFIEPLKRLTAAHGVFFVTGNHEGYLGGSAPLATLSKAGITCLDNEIIEIDGLQIIGLSFPEHGTRNDIQGLLSDPNYYDPRKPAVLMYHTPTDIDTRYTDQNGEQTGTYWRPDTDMALAKSAGIDLQLSGHTHGGQFFPFTLLTRFIFSGYDYGLHRDGDFQIYITSGTGTWGPPMRVACPPEIPVITLH